MCVWQARTAEGAFAGWGSNRRLAWRFLRSSRQRLSYLGSGGAEDTGLAGPGCQGWAPGVGMTRPGGDGTPRPARPTGAASALGPCGERAPAVGIAFPERGARQG